jgi:Ni/Fe-hydrogenase subunit HybB-like protein
MALTRLLVVAVAVAVRRRRRHLGDRLAGDVGFRDHQLRLVDRHRLSGGTFISALFFLLRVEWRTSLNRIAESMTLFAAACAGIYPILHLGRPWLFYWLFPYPNTMTLWPQFRSPLLWDFFAILTYVLASVLFWYLGLIPGPRQRARPGDSRASRSSTARWPRLSRLRAAVAAPPCDLRRDGRDHGAAGVSRCTASSGWISPARRRRLAFHQFPPFFVFGAVLSGFATVLLLIMPLRRLLRLEATSRAAIWTCCASCCSPAASASATPT